ncbi:MAG: thiamine-binding protein [Actinomycetota bacterium]
MDDATRTSGPDARVRAEFSIYPFVEGLAYPSHVQVAVDVIDASGLDAEFGALSQTITGPVGSVLDASRRATEAALREGARRIVVNIEVLEV